MATLEPFLNPPPLLWLEFDVPVFCIIKFQLPFQYQSYFRILTKSICCLGSKPPWINNRMRLVVKVQFVSMSFHDFVAIFVILWGTKILNTCYSNTHTTMRVRGASNHTWLKRGAQGPRQRNFQPWSLQAKWQIPLIVYGTFHCMTKHVPRHEM